MNKALQIIRRFFKLIDVSHTLFGLPYAVSAMALAAGGVPPFRIIFWTLFCIFFAGSGAMALNRWADAKIDAANPRTKGRLIPSGKIPRDAAILFVIVCYLLFVFGCYQMNDLTFKLSPIPLVIFTVYVYAKRFTAFKHIIMGLAMGLVPVGAWIAVAGSVDWRILIFALGVFSWYVGFDLFYAIQDSDFFKKSRLYSIPSTYGDSVAIISARNMHLFSYILFFIHGGLFSLGLFYFIGFLIAGAILLYEHDLVSKYGVSKLDKRFFAMNSVISVIFCLATLMDIAYYGYRG